MKKSFFLILIALALSIGAMCIEDTDKYYSISMDEAALLMENQTDYALVDVRTEAEFNKKHIPGAINIPNEGIVSDDIEQLPDKEQTILVYCRSGIRSKQAAQKLRDFGYTNVYEIGGILDWNGETVSSNDSEE